jgi:hypothetical protein
MWNPKEDEKVTGAVRDYVDAHGFILPEDADFQPSIDCVMIFVDNKHALTVGLPPVSQYPVKETEYTYLLYPQSPAWAQA